MSSKADSARAVESIAKFMSPRLLPQEAGTDTARPIEAIGVDGPWTAWEQVMIAGRWMASLGFDARIYWAQKFPSGPDGPSSPSIWREPVLRVTDGKGRDVYFKAGQKGDPEKLHPSLYGETLYRAGNAGVEQIKLPRGSASDHALTQNWKMVLGENGAASGSLDVTFTGAWMGILAPNGEIEEENIVAELLEIMNFDTPGIDFEAKSLKPLGSGCRITLDFTAAPGIVSQNNILFRLVGGVPRSFEEIPKVGAKYSFRFPFVFEVNSTVVTPKGYRALALPGKTQIGDSKSALDQSLVHWTKRRIAEASCRWIVRSAAVDEYQSGRIAEQVALVTAWPATAVPLQK
ncbi:MAG: hypothetical protein LBQ36_00975 [Synergistaceae bacterium]|jgi:hypothetical protein|nr:hypothetical protein [Synergistaceae bacterium]